MYINRFLGRSLHFKNGFHIGFNWMHGNGHSSKTAAVLAGYHHPNSITWRWSLQWIKPNKHCWWKLKTSAWPEKGRRYTTGSRSILLPLIGGFTVSWQQHMFRK